jgi:catalase
VEEGAVVELIAPTVGGVTGSDGTLIAANHKIDGAPSVLFDAVALLLGEEGVLPLLKLPPARDFVADAYAHYKFIGFTAPAVKLFKKVGLPDDLDDGFIALSKPGYANDFIATCRKLRFWNRPDGA